MTYLCAGDLSSKDFMALFIDQSWAEDTLFIGFSPAEARFERLADIDSSFVSQTEQGRIFSPSGELSWRLLDTVVRAVYLGEYPPGRLIDCSDKLTGLTSVSRQMLLWGVRTDIQDEWMEQQVPHRFIYPLDTREHSRGRAALMVEEWKDTAKNICFSRYHSISEIKGDE